MNKNKWSLYDSPTLNKIIATFETKREVIAYGEKHQINADQVTITNSKYPDGYVFLGWDEIDGF